MTAGKFQIDMRKILILIVAAMLLGACGTDMSDLDAYIADVNARPAEPISPIPPVKTYSPYVYDGLTGRDPFRPSTNEGSDDAAAMSNYDGPRPDQGRAKEYLERFELDTLEMVGTLALGESHWGLIRDPEGVVHRVSVNNFVGKNHGRVVAIQEMQLSLSELIMDGMGGWLVRDASIAVGEG